MTSPTPPSTSPDPADAPAPADTPDTPDAPDAQETQEAPDAFGLLLGEAMTGAERFGHRQHVRLTWLAVRRHGVDAALGLITDGIRRTAAKAGAPQKFHVTMTRAWVELVAHHLAAHHADAAPDFAEIEEIEEIDGFNEFDGFADRHPDLLDKELLARHYRPATLASEQARTAWVEPDLTPFPWADQLS
ncbi:hypothetical protein [Streptomyces sp. 1331.2]|uniref:hypothetical protein n=1 Tax=Streptomyces sp. 1331.2 TaxID=1938835 RepID=UPI000BD83C44|nr:hypothetical protein [Streptomyces sp. 1331.2]SOB81141.1 hypothetical protein SAMN06272789_1307 [Streptomyces sp. 1331.2]